MNKMNIYQKIVELRKSVTYLQKNEHGQKGVSSSSVLAEVRPKMNELGIVLIPNITHHNTFPKKNYGKDDSIELFTEINIEYTWLNSDDPKDQFIINWYSQGLDTGEKGIGKALTYGEKYMILKVLQIPTDKDDPDTFTNKNIKLMTNVQIEAIKKKCVENKVNIKDFSTLHDISRNTTTKEEADIFLKNIDDHIKSFLNDNN